MTGYMNEIVFSRILGHDDIEQGAYWVDGTQCWMCQKWNKVSISWNPTEDKMLFMQKINKLESLHQTIQHSVAQYYRDERKDQAEIMKLEAIPEHDFDSSYIEEVPEEMEVTTRFTGTVGKQTGFRSSTMKMTGLMKTGGLMKTIKSTINTKSQRETT